MIDEKLKTVFEVDSEYLKSLGDTKKRYTEFEVRLKTLELLGGDVGKTPPTLFEVERKILEVLGGDSTQHSSIYSLRKAVAESLGVDVSKLKNVYEIALAILNAGPVGERYTITFVNYDGTVLETKQVLEGETPTYTGATPTRESDEEYTYTFSGWEPEIDIAASDVTYTAQFTATKQVYTIKFVNYDGSVLGNYFVAYGATPSYLGETPVKPSDEEYNYTFIGWLPEISPVSGNTEYVAQFEATEIPVGTNYVTFTTEQANSTLGLSKLSTNQTLEYSTDATTWNTMDTSTSITLANVDDEVYVRGILSDDNSTSDYTQFKMTGKIAASGNCNAIWNYEDLEAPLKTYCGYNMFRACSLTKAPELPATTLASGCYQQIFNACRALTTAPELPATTLATYCYHYMFTDCTSLTTAPELPATTLEGSCYRSIFNGCTALTKAPELPATTLANYCYDNMFNGCTSLTEAPELPATTLATYCYRYMFQGCTSLTEAPELPATTLATYCYQYMFKDCTSLTTAPELPATTLATYCYHYMFQGCTSLTEAPELPATTLANYCYYGMFYGCKALTTAPELPATTLSYYCYGDMFSWCTNLNKITCLATNTSASKCTDYWLNKVSSTGIFIKNPNKNNWTTGVSGIPEGWTVEDYTG